VHQTVEIQTVSPILTQVSPFSPEAFGGGMQGNFEMSFGRVTRHLCEG
jgi:hypothetical protein